MTHFCQHSAPYGRCRWCNDEVELLVKQAGERDLTVEDIRILNRLQQEDLNTLLLARRYRAMVNAEDR